MAEQEVSVIARMQAKKGKEKELKQELAALIGPSRAEPGCITYVLHQSVEDKNSFMFFRTLEGQKRP